MVCMDVKNKKDKQTENKRNGELYD